MRGRQVKVLRRLTRLLHGMMVKKGEIAPPESEAEMEWQRRRLYRILKSRWKMLSKPKCLASEVSKIVSTIVSTPTPPSSNESESDSPEQSKH